MDASRRETLRELMELASESTPGSCWNDTRAVALLRSQTTPDELREIGASEALIEHIFSERHAC